MGEENKIIDTETCKMTRKNYGLLFKLLLMGNSGVGKTSILSGFSGNALSSGFISIIGIDFKIKTIQLRGEKIKLQIWHTAGEERFHTIAESYYQGAMGILLVYDITNAKSFYNIVKWLRNIQEHSTNVQKMILGNKCDMEDNRVISKERGETLARKNGVRFLETSAKTNINIEKAFMELSESILDKIPGVIEPREPFFDANNMGPSPTDPNARITLAEKDTIESVMGEGKEDTVASGCAGMSTGDIKTKKKG